MTIYFRAEGSMFDVDAWCMTVPVGPAVIWRVGDSSLRGGHGGRRLTSGFSVEIPTGTADDLPASITIASCWLAQHRNWIACLAGAGAVAAELSLMVHKVGDDIAVPCFTFPPRFVALCGELRVGIELNVWIDALVDGAMTSLPERPVT